jgi:hypothetical protein
MGQVIRWAVLLTASLATVFGVGSSFSTPKAGLLVSRPGVSRWLAWSDVDSALADDVLRQIAAVDGMLQSIVIQATVDELIRRHEVLLARFPSPCEVRTLAGGTLYFEQCLLVLPRSTTSDSLDILLAGRRWHAGILTCARGATSWRSRLEALAAVPITTSSPASH